MLDYIEIRLIRRLLMDRMHVEKQEHDNEQSLLLSARHLAKLLNVSVRQIWRLAATGRLPHYVRLGGSVRWKNAEIVEWIEKGCPDRESWNAMKGGAKC